MARSPLEVTGAFISAINARDLTALRSLMTDDHIFTDARGTKFMGADNMIENWVCFFNSYPQYWIRIDSSFTNGNRVALFGETGGKWRIDGRIQPGSWKISASWLAEVAHGKVRRWNIYCETEWSTPPMFRFIPPPKMAILEA